MRRFIVLGDIHIGDYPRYNGIVNRLGQFNTLADRLVQLEADDVIIAGDFLLNCVMKPSVMHVVKNFIKKLCNRFDNVYYILGNHDLDVKLQKFSGTDSFITLFSTLDNLEDATSFKNFKYMHDKHLKVEDVDFYFMDWIHSSTVPLKETCDIFISHINLMPRFGQEIDNSKFKLGIFGDYHARFSRENMITTGTPIQHYISDPAEPMVLRLDINGNQFSHRYVPIETDDIKFLKIYHDYDCPSPLGPLDVKVTTRTKSKASSTEFNKIKVNLDKQLEEILTNNDLMDIHKEVLSIRGDIEPLDLDFYLKKIKIKDFRSISDLEVEFDDNKLVYLQGANGSGKTTLIQAICVALFGDRHMKRFIRKGTGYTEVDLTLEYQGRLHRIVRAPGYLYYQINDTPQDANNKASLQESIVRNLPFIPYLGDFIINSHTTFFSSCNRIALFTRLFGLDRYVLYLQTGAQLKSNYEVKKVGKLNERNNNEIQVKSYREFIDTQKSKLPETLETATEDELKKFLTTLESSYNNYKFYRDSVDKLTGELQGLPIVDDSKLEQYTSELAELEAKYKTLSEIKDKFKLLSNYESQLKTYVDLISKSTYVKKCESCGNEVEFNLSDPSVLNHRSELESKVAELSTQLKEYTELEVSNTLASCKSEIDLKLSSINSIKSHLDIMSRISEYTNNREAYLKEIESEQMAEYRIQLYKDRISELKVQSEIMESIKTYTDKVEALNKVNVELDGEIKELDATISRYFKYLELFSLANHEGIPYQILKSITESISDEELTFTTEKELASGKVQFRVSCQLNIDGTDIDFDELSDGQQSYASLKILSKLSKTLPKIGLVMLDEPLKHVDEGNINQCINLLKDINSNTIILSSHSPSFNYADKVISFSLMDGKSIISEN